MALMENRERESSLATDIESAFTRKASTKPTISSSKCVPSGTYASPYFKDPYGSLPPPNSNFLRAVVVDMINFPSTARRRELEERQQQLDCMEEMHNAEQVC